jgi:hypothetical protein
MSSPSAISAQQTVRRIHRIQAITMAWMTIEAAISLTSACKARSPALLAFGGDSAIELLSAMAVLWRFTVHVEPEKAEKRASRVAGALLFVLSAYVLVISVRILRGYAEPKPTYFGIGILIAGSSNHAVDCQGKAQTLLSHEQRGIESRRCPIVVVCIFRVNCPRRIGNQCPLARSVGGPNRSSSHYAADYLGRPGGNPRQVLRLLLSPSSHPSQQIRLSSSQLSESEDLAFVCGRTMQTGEEPVKVALRLASLDL